MKQKCTFVKTANRQSQYALECTIYCCNIFKEQPKHFPVNGEIFSTSSIMASRLF